MLGHIDRHDRQPDRAPQCHVQHCERDGQPLSDLENIFQETVAYQVIFVSISLYKNMAI